MTMSAAMITMFPSCRVSFEHHMREIPANRLWTLSRCPAINQRICDHIQRCKQSSEFCFSRSPFDKNDLERWFLERWLRQAELRL